MLAKAGSTCGRHRATSNARPLTNASALISQYGFAIVALIIVAGELGLPVFVPGEIALLLTGDLLIHSLTALVLSIAVFGMLDFTATSALNLAARTGGNRALRGLLRRYRGDDSGPARYLDVWRRRVRGRDAYVIFVMRFIPVVRMYASLISGLLRVPLSQFLAGAGPAAFIWAAIPLIAGYVLGRNATTIQHHYGDVVNVVLVLLGLVIIGFGIRWYLRRRLAHGKSRSPTA